MAHIEDLSVCTYFHDEELPVLLAVGWLEVGHPYETGDVPPGLLARLEEFRRMRDCPWPSLFLGGHDCSLCGDPESYSYRNLAIPGDGVVYVAPEGIVHYISAHRYGPPDRFVQAVLGAPAADSPEYRAALRAAGWPDFPCRPDPTHSRPQASALSRFASRFWQLLSHRG